jgi:hypothetical protein
MKINIEPLYRVVWDDTQGTYIETVELLGYKAVDWLGQIIAFGESREMAYENALEVVAAALGDD